MRGTGHAELPNLGSSDQVQRLSQAGARKKAARAPFSFHHVPKLVFGISNSTAFLYQAGATPQQGITQAATICSLISLIDEFKNEVRAVRMENTRIQAKLADLVAQNQTSSPLTRVNERSELISRPEVSIISVINTSPRILESTTCPRLQSRTLPRP